MTIQEWKSMPERTKEMKFRCRVYCVHAFQNQYCDWYCGRCKKVERLDFLYPKICKHYEERPQLGMQIKDSCVASIAAQLDSHIEAVRADAKSGK